MLPYRFCIKPWVMSTVFFLTIIGCLYVDRAASVFFKESEQSYLHVFDQVLNHVAQGVLILPVVLLMMVYFKWVKHHSIWFYRMAYLCYILMIDHVFLSLLKLCCGRARPYLYIDQHIFGFYPFTFSYDYFSFPSGHTMVLMTLAGFIALLLTSNWRYLVLCGGFFMSFSRVWQNLHYLSDWYFSAYLSLLIFPIATLVLKQLLPLKTMHALNKAMGFSSVEA